MYWFIMAPYLATFWVLRRVEKQEKYRLYKLYVWSDSIAT